MFSGCCSTTPSYKNIHCGMWIQKKPFPQFCNFLIIFIVSHFTFILSISFHYIVAIHVITLLFHCSILFPMILKYIYLLCLPLWNHCSYFSQLMLLFLSMYWNLNVGIWKWFYSSLTLSWSWLSLFLFLFVIFVLAILRIAYLLSISVVVFLWIVVTLLFLLLFGKFGGMCPFSPHLKQVTYLLLKNDNLTSS